MIAYSFQIRFEYLLLYADFNWTIKAGKKVSIAVLVRHHTKDSHWEAITSLGGKISAA